MSKDADPDRRRFTFRLRTMLALVVLVATMTWLGTNLNWIRQRHAFLAAFDATHEFNMPIDHCGAPGILKYLGEKGRRWIFIHADRLDGEPISEKESDVVRMASRLFPESDVEVIPRDYVMFFERFFPERTATLNAAGVSD